MATKESSSDLNVENDLPLELIILSCGVCQATLPEVYATKESNRGFHSDSGGDNGVVTKLWIAECSHIMCGKHLPGGAAPFHPKGEQPRAPCLQCQERGDDGLKDLYGIRGLDKTEMDTAIPPEWLQCPAIKLDGTISGMEAVRFQYMNVARYAQRVTNCWKHSERQRHAMETSYSRQHKQRRHLQQEILELKARVEAMEGAEAKLRKWEARKPLIHHYLQAVNDMSSDIALMRSRLLQLGYDVPNRSYAFGSDSAAQKSGTSANDRPSKQGQHGKSFSSSSTAIAPEHITSSSTRKRKLAEYAPEPVEHVATRIPRLRGSSRELMPPPLPRLPQRTGLPAVAPFARPQAMPIPSHQDHEEHIWQREATEERDEAFPQLRLHAQALPYRPSPGNTLHRQEHRLNRVPYQHDTVHDRTLHYDVEANGRVPQRLLAHREREELLAFQADHSQTAAARAEIPDAHYHAGCGPVAHRPGNPASTPRQSFSASQTDQQLSGRSGNRHGLASPGKTTAPPAASVISPFFKRGMASRLTTLRSPTKVSHGQPQYRTQGQHARMTSLHDDHVQGRPQRSDLNGSAFADGLRRTVDYQPLYNRPAGPIVGNRYAGTCGVAQTPRNSQGLFQRPEGPLPPVSYAHGKPQSIAYRGRVSIPPSRQTVIPAASSQEKTLSQIPGVRGVSSLGVRPTQHHDGPLYDAPRAQYSSAGGRRSVRR